MEFPIAVQDEGTVARNEVAVLRSMLCFARSWGSPSGRVLDHELLDRRTMEIVGNRVDRSLDSTSLDFSRAGLIGFKNVIVMIPFRRSTKEAERALDVVAANSLTRGTDGLQSTSCAGSPRT